MNLSTLLTNLNSKISFSTIIPDTPAVITGTMVSILDYDDARQLYDVEAVTAAVNTGLAVEDELTASECNYVVIKSSSGVRTIYAYEWMDDTTITVLNATSDVTVELQNVTAAEADAVVRYAASLHISAKIKA